MPGEEVPQTPMKPLGRDFDFSHLVDENAPQPEMSVEAAAVHSDPEAPSALQFDASKIQKLMPNYDKGGDGQSGELDKSAGMPEDGGASLTEAATSGNSGRRAVVNTPKSEWTPAMHRKAALASGNIVHDTFGAIEKKPIHPGQLGKGTEG